MDKIFSVKDVAVKLEVTRQTVYNHIDKNFESLKGDIKKIQGTTYLTEQGLNIIKESMGLIKIPVQNEVIGIEEIIKEISENMDSSIKESMENVKEDIKQDYNKLENELAEVKKQNEILIQMIQDQQEKKSIFDIFKRK